MPKDLYDDADLGGGYAADDHRGGFGGDYARESRWGGGTGARDYASYRGRGPKNDRRSDVTIAEEVNERLTDDPYVDASHIEVRVEDGVVHLSGRVRTRGEKRRADHVAGNCGGVHDVMNALRIARTDDEVEIGKATE